MAAKETNPAEGWEYPDTLPESFQGFVRQNENRWDKQIFHIFSYVNEQERRGAVVVYDKSTREFMLRITIGLTEFCDVQFIHPDRNSFEKILQRALLPRLETLACCLPERMEYLFREKKITDWACETELPSRSNGFEMFLCPRTCIQFTNGSYLILDYSDFGLKSSLRFFYNVFRDDFFAEYLVIGAPQATQRFDCKTLSELKDKLRRDLDNATMELRERIRDSMALHAGSLLRND